jgi:predicted nucleotidyltransferase
VNIEKWVADNTIFKAVAGSRLYGTSTEKSDYDFLGVCLDTPENLIGVHRFGQFDKIGEGDDLTIYAVSKFLGLCAKNNPSIVDVLFTPKEFWLHHTNDWQVIYENRHRFLSQRSIKAYIGYAYSQLSRIERHRKWMEHPPEEPILEDFGLMLVSTRTGAQRIEPIPSRYTIGEWRKIIKRGTVYRKQDKTRLVARYHQEERNWKNYQTWKEKRNPERAVLEFMHGYDTKHAAHLVRLMLQLREIVCSGTYSPVLSGENLQMVLLVLNGEWRYYDLLDWAKGMERGIEEQKMSLPKKMDRHILDELLTYFAAKSLSRDPEFTRHFLAETGGDG